MVGEQPNISKTLWASGLKRGLDLLKALVLAVLLVPIWLPAAVLVKLTSSGPVLFSQTRGGRDGRPFKLYKFRTMRGERTPDPLELVPLDHPEITRVGRWLRRLKLDEIPQLINVIKGEMSLVGPRPTLMEQVEAYDEFRRQRLLVRPGITGLAQVNGSTSLPWHERILYDVAYVRRLSAGMDAGILLKTIWVTLVGEAKAARRFKDTKYASYVTPPAGYEEAYDPETGLPRG